MASLEVVQDEVESVDNRLPICHLGILGSGFFEVREICCWFQLETSISVISKLAGPTVIVTLPYICYVVYGNNPGPTPDAAGLTCRMHHSYHK